MERPEWEEPVETDAPQLYPVAPIPLHERSWRHPSELGETSTFVVPPAPELHRGALILAGLFGLACVVGLALVLLPGDPPADPQLAGPSTPFVATSLTLTSRTVDRPWIGIDGQDDRGHGVLVAAVVTDSPAHHAGVLAGDLIVAIDGAPVSDTAALRSAVDAASIGSAVSLTVMRSGEAHALAVWLEPEP